MFNLVRLTLSEIREILDSIIINQDTCDCDMSMTTEFADAVTKRVGEKYELEIKQLRDSERSAWLMAAALQGLLDDILGGGGNV